MMLWEIKAQSLKIMFADTDVEFSEEEFSSGTIYENPNTGEKLRRMEDSIRRAVDLYFQYCGTLVQTKRLKLKYDEQTKKYFNIILTTSATDFGFPTRIDIIQDIPNGIMRSENIAFNFDMITKEIFFTDDDFTLYNDNVLENLTFLVFYKQGKTNMPFGINEMTYNLNVLNIPEDIQRQIPLYVKGEIYEEDEERLAAASRMQYVQYLVLNQRQTYSKNQTKVKRKSPRNLA